MNYYSAQFSLKCQLSHTHPQDFFPRWTNWSSGDKSPRAESRDRALVGFRGEAPKSQRQFVKTERFAITTNAQKHFTFPERDKCPVLPCLRAPIS